MKVTLAQFPEEGAMLQGEADGDYLMLQEEEWRQAGPLKYDLQVGRRGGGGKRVWAAGTVALPVCGRCVRCLELFELIVKSHGYAFEGEPAGGVIDLTESLREEIVLALPVHPDCAADGNRRCPGVKNPAGFAEQPSEAQPVSDHRWAGLSRLDVSSLKRVENDPSKDGLSTPNSKESAASAP